ncbi:hypothetical protein QNI19_30650 [Cytophagaceae bacterium DM2B3-1]|uniref:Uncharacterized protein n=1 Tax=Xanthocytophaga flava TaxID=3048013 RepID=A0ABT7CU92_9BACT|nr:hypothetical protein [Xanthocytophaga flavus]MDJ1469117.1 hypothetical protein [Xanthocytophaga flavus]MDJ1497338.1 hypothetical protein [Xanthocytophaga flavus]
MVSLHPVNGWNTLLKMLHDNHVFSLPDMDKIYGLVDNWADGTTYIVEVATPTMYRFYRYHLPEKFSDKFQQAQQMVNIVSAVEETFMLKKQRKQQERLLRK